MFSTAQHLVQLKIWPARLTLHRHLRKPMCVRVVSTTGNIKFIVRVVSGRVQPSLKVIDAVRYLVPHLTVWMIVWRFGVHNNIHTRPPDALPVTSIRAYTDYSRVNMCTSILFVCIPHTRRGFTERVSTLAHPLVTRVLEADDVAKDVVRDSTRFCHCLKRCAQYC